MMSELEWLKPEQVANFERISRVEVYSRMEAGDSRPFIWKEREDRPGRLVDPRSMSFDAQERWRKCLLETAGTAPGQLNLLPRTEVDDQIDALKLPHWQRDMILRRLRVVSLFLNCNWRAAGFSSKRAFARVVADCNRISVRSIYRWTWAYRQNGKLEDLACGLPGPQRGTGKVLDLDMRAHLQDCYVLKKLKQNSPGCRVGHLYQVPSPTTVKRFLRSLDPIDKAAREGADALKAACGYIDRTYRGLHSLQRVCVDEWITDVLAYDPHKVSRVGRYYLLTFLDERSLYPLVWSLVEQPNEDDEIELLCRLIREFGVPGLINSDRGRFRGRTFGGKFVDRERAEMYEQRDGILDRLEIRRNIPREHNPRGSRLERFHLELANWARNVPGWCGRDTKERRITDADLRVAQHKAWIRTGQGEPPLLSRDQLLERINQFMAEYRQRPSDGNDMDGFAPEAVFRQNTPEEGFRRITDEELTWHTAEHFEVLIGKGGIIQLRDGTRYSDPELLLVQGERREVARARHNHEQIAVLARGKGEEAIIAKRRVRVGVNDPDELARQMELQARLRKLAGAMVKPMEYEPGSQFAAVECEPPKAGDMIQPSEFVAAQEPPPLDPSREIGSVQFMMEKDRYKRWVKPLDFADLEG
jgi:hypothetical protein